MVAGGQVVELRLMVKARSPATVAGGKFAGGKLMER